MTSVAPPNYDPDAPPLDLRARAIKEAPDLHDLLDALRAFQDALRPGMDCENELGARGIDLADLKTFGGEKPRHTIAVWSWDETQVLVGEGPFREWAILDREDWAADHEEG